jgi:hypothetical protein
MKCDTGAFKRRHLLFWFAIYLSIVELLTLPAVLQK